MKKYVILISIFNDWKSVFKVLQEIDLAISVWTAEVSILIVNDASTENKNSIKLNFKNIKSVRIMNMKKNRGHARCNAAGLKFLTEKENFDYVILMDGDGEDRPEEIKQLIDNLKHYPDKAIVGVRVKRSENIFFKFCYAVHKLLTFTFTGQSIKFGNYTCLPKFIVEKMVNEKATWCSFSGSLAKVAKDRASVPSERGSRYFGPSKMSFMNLVKHSLSIIAVFRINVLIRSILFLLIYLFLVSQNISLITLIPIPIIIVMVVVVFATSSRENITEFNNSLINISNIEILK